LAAIKGDGNMENLKLPIALVIAMAAQLSAGVWWVSQQAATISNLEETVSQLGSRIAIEDNVNLKRDVQDNALEIEWVNEELEELWDELSAMTAAINEINKIKQRVAIIENDLKYIGRDHNTMFDMKGE
jgi:DNA repair exonuclease SbcCD ATPase subunit